MNAIDSLTKFGQNRISSSKIVSFTFWVWPRGLTPLIYKFQIKKQRFSYLVHMINVCTEFGTNQTNRKKVGPGRALRVHTPNICILNKKTTVFVFNKCY